ncbi:arylesterase, partial [Acinetobacter sp. A11]
MSKSFLIGSKSIMLISLNMLPMLVSAKTILILGDSISAGYGIDPKQGWVQLLQKR